MIWTSLNGYLVDRCEGRYRVKTVESHTCSTFLAAWRREIRSNPVCWPFRVRSQPEARFSYENMKRGVVIQAHRLTVISNRLTIPANSLPSSRGVNCTPYYCCRRKSAP